MDGQAFARLVDVGYEELGSLFRFGDQHRECVDAMLGPDSSDDENDQVAEVVHQDKKAAKLEPLPEHEIRDVRGRIKELHPLSETPLVQLFPRALCCLRRCSRKAAEAANPEHRALSAAEAADVHHLKTVDRRLSKIIKKSGFPKYEGTDALEDDERIDEEKLRGGRRSVKSGHGGDGRPGAEAEPDPFSGYGFGVIAYFSLLSNLIAVYVVICAIGLLMMHFNSSQATEKADPDQPFVAKYSLGNLGYVRNGCRT